MVSASPVLSAAARSTWSWSISTTTHLFTPLLYEVGTALLDPSEIAYPVRGIFQHIANVDFKVGRVTGIDLEARVVRTAEGALDYDYLVVAAGSVNNFFGNESAAQHAFALKDLGEALALRNHVLAQFEEASWTDDPAQRRRLMSLVVVGGGPTGVEFAGALSELIHLVLRKDFPKLQLEEVEVHMVEAVDHVLGAFDAHLQEWAVARLRRMGVQVRLGAAVEAIDAERVRLTDGNVIEASTVVWTAGVKASGLGPSLAWSWDAVAACRLAPTLQLAGQPEVFVIGDMAQGTDPEGQPLPQLAAVAQQQGKRWRGPSAPSTKVGRPSLSGTSARAPWRQSGATPPSSRWVGCASRASLAGSPGSRST